MIDYISKHTCEDSIFQICYMYTIDIFQFFKHFTRNSSTENTAWNLHDMKEDLSGNLETWFVLLQMPAVWAWCLQAFIYAAWCGWTRLSANFTLILSSEILTQQFH